MRSREPLPQPLDAALGRCRRYSPDRERYARGRRIGRVKDALATLQRAVDLDPHAFAELLDILQRCRRPIERSGPPRDTRSAKQVAERFEFGEPLLQIRPHGRPAQGIAAELVEPRNQVVP